MITRRKEGRGRGGGDDMPTDNNDDDDNNDDNNNDEDDDNDNDNDGDDNGDCDDDNNNSKIKHCVCVSGPSVMRGVTVKHVLTSTSSPPNDIPSIPWSPVVLPPEMGKS